VLRVDEIPEPEPGPRELLVRLRATSVNRRDIWMRNGHPHPAYHVDLPAILGIDFCGDVVAVGAEVESFVPGDRVTASPYMHCGRCPWCVRGRFQYCPRFTVYAGTYAELFLVPADFAIVVDESVPDEHVAAFPNTYITAWQMLTGKAQISAADTVFVWAGTSGLGSAAIEIAKLAGATVLTSAGSAAKRERLAELPADAVLDHHAPDLVERVLELTGGEGASIVFEHVGQATWERSLELCAPGGTIVSAGATSGDDARLNVTYLFAKQVRIIGSRLGTMADAVAAAKHLSAGRFRPLVGRVLSLDELGEAHRLMDEGGARRQGDRQSVVDMPAVRRAEYSRPMRAVARVRTGGSATPRRSVGQLPVANANGSSARTSVPRVVLMPFTVSSMSAPRGLRPERRPRAPRRRSS
jgi:NADPH:quinone reductase-like Zn-dependent oxidoreductase